MKKLLFYCPQTSFKSSIALLLMRIVFGGGMFIWHGWDKFINFGDKLDKFPDPIGIGVFPSLLLVTLAETISALLVMAGFMTRVMLVPLIFTMLVAVSMKMNMGRPFADIEMAVLYLGSYLVLLIGGPGKFSVDRYLK